MPMCVMFPGPILKATQTYRAEDSLPLISRSLLSEIIGFFFSLPVFYFLPWTCSVYPASHAGSAVGYSFPFQCRDSEANTVSQLSRFTGALGLRDAVMSKWVVPLQAAQRTTRRFFALSSAVMTLTKTLLFSKTEYPSDL